MKKYDVILADPPWKFEYWIPGQGKKNGSRAAQAHYPVMNTEDICKLGLGRFGKENSILFLWGVWPRIQDTFDVMEAWGYEYKTVGFVWVKSNKTGFGHFMGMGYYTRSNTEPCLLATRGSIPVQDHSVSQLLYTPVRKHSQKPDLIYSKIEALYPDMDYLELFARRKREGWDVWGNEVESDIKLEI